jgi:hypothetical protein
MNIKIDERGGAQIDLLELFHGGLSPSARRALIASMACDEEIFRAVADQLVDGGVEGNGVLFGVADSVRDEIRARLVASVDKVAAELVRDADARAVTFEKWREGELADAHRKIERLTAEIRACPACPRDP